MTHREWLDGLLVMYARILRRNPNFIRWIDTGQPLESHVRVGNTLRKIHGPEWRPGADVRHKQGIAE